MSAATRRSMVKLLLLAVVALMSMLLLASCGGEPPDGNTSRLGPSPDSQEAIQARYDQDMAKVRDLIEDPKQPPVQMSVDLGRRNQLLAMALRWDQATANVKAIEAPDDIAALHAKLAKSMTQLGGWNRKIAAAAPDRKATRRLFRQAQNSKASRDFGDAVAAIEKRGYHVMTEPEQSAIDGAPSTGP